jgi:Protein of unknown function (DUF4031)
VTVFVDDWQQLARVGRLHARWSHLTVGPFDDLAELHEFAAGIGLQRRWFQDKPWPRAHYDVTESKRQEAIKAGAVAITWREVGRQMMRAVDARKKATAGNLVCARTADGKPPGDEDLRIVAKALYELAQMKEATDA